MDQAFLDKLVLQQEARLKAQAEASTIEFKERKGWQEKGLYFTCKPNVAHPWNPSVVKAIWEFDPRIVPCWVNWVFLAPPEDANAGQEVVFGRHVLALHIEDPEAEIDDFPCEMPAMPCQGISFKKPNKLVSILMHKNEKNDLPGDYIEFDWPIVEWLRARFVREQSAKELAREYVNSVREGYNRRKAQLADDMEYRRRDLQKFVDSKLANVSEVEIKNYLLRKRERAKKPFLIT